MRVLTIPEQYFLVVAETGSFSRAAQQLYVSQSSVSKHISQMENELAAYNEMPLPAIIPIPGVSGNTGAGLARVRKSVEKAVGSDIIFGND